MPTTITNLLNEFKLELSGQVKWGEEIKSKESGFYFIAISDNPDKIISWETPSFNDKEIQQWIELVKNNGKNILVDKEVASIEDIKNRSKKLWLKDETILYIGKAGPNKKRTIKKRVNEYYRTKLGCDGKHAGGHWINTLLKLNDLTVYYSEFEETSDESIENLERKLIDHFKNNVSTQTKTQLFDNENCFPFANKEVYYRNLKKKIRKRHGIENQTINCGKNWKKNNG